MSDDYLHCQMIITGIHLEMVTVYSLRKKIQTNNIYSLINYYVVTSKTAFVENV